jgi:cobalt-zinc-cadmium resistance protein CzcA
MTATMGTIGLLPAVTSHSFGSESQRPLSIVIIGGLVCSAFFVLFVFPLIVEKFYHKMLFDKSEKLIHRKL